MDDEYKYSVFKGVLIFMETQSEEAICPSCKLPVSAVAYFCSNCGRQLRDRPLATTLSKKIIAYSVSLFLPPFGLLYAWKYLKRADYESRKTGIIAAVLTAISILATTWLAGALVDSVNQSLESINDFNF